MKLITFYTNSHKKMFDDYFKPSMENYGFELITMEGHQYSSDGNYFTEGFNETTSDKINFLSETLDTLPENEFVLFSDVDIIFLNDISDYINQYKNYDMVFQNGYGGLNTGFFLIKNISKVRELLKKVVEVCHQYHDDQLALNAVIKFFNIKHTMFDDKILSPAAIIGPKVWTGEELEINEEVLVFHACWCAGVDNKIKLLDYVRNYQKLKTK